MQSRPKILWLVMLIYIGICLSFPIQIIALYELDSSQWLSSFSYLTPLNFICMTLLLLSMPLIFNASRWLMLSIPCLTFCISINNYIVSSVGFDFSPSMTYWATIGFVTLNGYVFLNPVRSLLLKPNRRWWMQAQRKRLQLPIEVFPIRGPQVTTKSFDLSSSGIFINDKRGLPELKEGEWIKLRIPLGGFYRVNMRAKVVRSSEAQGDYPKGYGLHFLQDDKEESHYLKQFLNSFEDTSPRDAHPDSVH